MQQGERLRMSSATVVYKYQQFVTRLRFMMNTKYKLSVMFVGVPLNGVGRKMCLFIGFRREKMLDNDGYKHAQIPSCRG